ncbi:MAG TPA: hypothetical protein EYN66_14505 [Myxococcales bacterium]|nr:hypothetical protein [Myxococcales bacterium]
MTGDPHANPDRCGAKTRAGHPCGRYAMPNGRCRLHGGLSTGPKTPEGLERSRKANWKHGRNSKQAIAERRLIKKLLSDTQEMIVLVDSVDGG